MTDELKGFGLAKLKMEPTKEAWAATLKEASRLWAEQRERMEAAELERWLGVVSLAKGMLEEGSSLEDVLMMVREEYEPEPESFDPEID